jgi:transketolase
MFSQFVLEYKKDLENIALAVRSLSLDAVLKAKSGHIGLPLGAAEIGTLLYFAVMHHNPKNPRWKDRDRFVLSAGHGSILQYVLLHLAGYDLSQEQLSAFRQWGSLTPGHPEYDHTPGVECTTGPLGQGMATAVGMALAERMLAARFNDSTATPINHRTFVMMGDGCLMEGVTAEACSFAGHLKLNRLIVLYDSNNITIDGTVDISLSENVSKRFASYNWNVLHADGNDFISLAKAFDSAFALSQMENGKSGPILIICRTLAGKGSPKWQGNPKVHGNPLTEEDVQEAKKHLKLQNTAFLTPPQSLLSAQKLIKFRTEKAQNWENTCSQLLSQWKSTHPEKYELWEQCFENKKHPLPKDFFEHVHQKKSTRLAASQALQKLATHNLTLVGGSADLAASNLTTLPQSSFVNAQDFTGRNIHFGVREHAMAAICNGITLHGGLRAYCATFSVFSDYMRPAIRLAALMKIPTLFIFTHDSYAVGEDGPTHQPIEQTASLRAMPRLQVFRPADALESTVAWAKILENQTSPTALLLSRQDLDHLDSFLPTPRSLSVVEKAYDLKYHQGAYLLKDFALHTKERKRLVMISSGSEVCVALQTALELEKHFHLSVRVVSAPAPQLLKENTVFLNHLLPNSLPLFAIEAGVAQGWGELVGREGFIFSMKDFGQSAPAQDLAFHFGFVPAKFTHFVLEKLSIKG